MKKTTLPKFSKRLTQYSALSVALTGLINANGQIIYEPLDPDFTVLDGEFYLDFNTDSNYDFKIKHTGGSYGFLRIIPTCCYNGVLGNNFNYSSAGDYRYPFALDYGTLISSSADPMGSPNNSWNSYYFYQNMGLRGSCGQPGYRSMWCGQTEKYLGLRFRIGGNTHYGWAKLSVDNTPAVNWTVHEYAYNSIPDEPITAGQKTLGIDENNLASKIRVVALNKSIGLYNLPETTNYKLYNMSGQSILQGKTNYDTYVIEANTLSSGIYILELVDPNSKAVLKKKLVL